MRAGLGVAVAVTAALVTAACATPDQGRTAARAPSASMLSPSTAVCTGFALSLAVDHSGRPSAMEAEESFIHTDEGTGFPRSGWQETDRDDTGVTLTSGSSTLHAVQVSDGTWFVDSGRQC
jgi:hypothetical protein